MAVPLSGRKAQAARNDEVILAAAREVFIANPEAPISAVAEKAGVGISALYRRYPSKDELLRTLCWNGLRTYIEVAEQALADESDPWTSFAAFMRGAVDAETSSLTVALAGTFTPVPEMFADGERAFTLNHALVDRARSAGVIREDFQVSDMAMIFEQLSAVKLGDAGRTRELRHRYLALILDGLRNPPVREPLPGKPPAEDELSARWAPR